MHLTILNRLSATLLTLILLPSLALAQFEVTSDNDVDDGTCDATHCSLREAINAANDNAGDDAITFNIAGGGMAATVQPNSPLPLITDAVNIDGSTQGCPANRCIELDGLNVLAAVSAGLSFQNHSGSILSNFVINGFDGSDRRAIELGLASSITIENCLIGTDFTGAAADANDLGIAIINSNDNIIRNNTISGNQRQGITGFTDSDGNIIENNIIGMDVSGTIAIPNGGGGVVFSGGSDNNLIANNTIAHNGIRGVQFNDGAQNRVTQNRIFNNTGLGIELLPAGVTANDPGDADTGANNLQNSPDLSSSALTIGFANSITVNYRVTSDPSNSAYPITTEFFLVDSDNQEGAVYLGQDIYSLSDAQLERNSSFLTEADVPDGATIVATATDANGNTSEFSSPRTLQSAFVVNSNDDADDGTCDASHCSLREAITASNSFAGADRINLISREVARFKRFRLLLNFR